MKNIEDRLGLLRAVIDGKFMSNELPAHVVNEQFLINLIAIAEGLMTNRGNAGYCIECAYEFTMWERRNVFSGDRDYADFRDQHGLDWDEVIGDYIEWKILRRSKWKFSEDRIKDKL